MSTDKTNQSWGGRFSEPVDAFVARFTASVTFDQRLYRHDIMGSIAHATMLAKVGVLTDAERDTHHRRPEPPSAVRSKPARSTGASTWKTCT